jgi:transcriptional regulator with XRE-family HTH domain
VEVREVLQHLGHRIRELRAARGWSQEEFADLCGLHRTYMGSVERGERNLTLKSLLTISKCLGITLSELVGGLEKKAGTSEKTPPRSKRQ